MVRGPAPHAVLLSGPAGVGKTTLALDLAAGLLCTAGDRAQRPCRACRGCRMVASGGHPDLHRLGPEGPGAQIVIGGRDAKVRGIRDLAEDLSLMPMEGGARVALITSAQRMNDDAQGALLKTLEEPPAGVTLILCADDEDRLLPTVRSRCARIRLGRVGSRDVESILVEHGITDLPLAGRLARISAGRPGIALAYARSPEAVRARGELARRLLDLSAASPSERLSAMRSAAPTAIDMIDALDAAAAAAAVEASEDETATSRTTGRRVPIRARSAESKAAAVARGAAAGAEADPDDMASDVEALDDGPVKAVPAARRRRAAEALIAIWLDVTRDLALVVADGARSVRDTEMLDETVAAAAGLPPDAAASFLARLARAAELIAGNVSPELVLDSLVLAWPSPRAT
jgi:DNA polymerase-3 subunit delta'